LLLFLNATRRHHRKSQAVEDEIAAIELTNREYRKLKNPGYPAQRLDEERRIRLVQNSGGDQGSNEKMTINGLRNAIHK
jgi:hypothetical protein